MAETRSREETRQILIKLIEPLVESRGIELIQLEYVTGKYGKLMLYIDRDGGIEIEHCEEVSRAVSEMLDQHDPITHAFNLEVSSPGLERPLTKKAHFLRFQGERVKIITTEPLEGSSKLSGTLQRAGEDAVTLRADDGAEFSLPYSLIARANLRYSGPEKKEKGKS
jgi:ribosome maturation factor RimP